MIKVVVETITPDRAVQMLERNKKNRKYRSRILNLYASEMKKKAWHPGVGSITFNGDGSLLDGQHRLQACILSQTAFESVVVTGISKEAQKVMDSGAARKVSDYLQMNGVDNAVNVASVAKNIYNMGVELDIAKGITQKGVVAHQELINFAFENPDIIVAANYAARLYKANRPGVLPIATAGSMYYVLSVHNDADIVEDFFEKIYSGVELSRTNPIFLLRRKLLSMQEMRATGGHMTKIIIAAMVVKTWNSHIKGEEPTKLFQRIDSKFPKLQHINNNK